MRTYKAYRELLASARWHTLAQAGAHPQRLLWASTGTKDPAASDTLYVEALAAPDTINTMPEKTLQAFADHGKVGAAMPVGRRRRRGGAGGIPARRASTTTRWPRSCSAKAPTAFSKSWKSPAGEDRRKERGCWRHDARHDQRRRHSLSPTRAADRSGRPGRRSTRMHRAMRQRAPAPALRRTIRGAASASTRRSRRPLPRLLEEPHHRRDAAAARRSSPRSAACASASTRCSAARQINVTEQRAVAARRAAARQGRADPRRRRRRRARGARRARPDGRVLPTRCAAASGGGTPASASATSSTSASAAPTSAR